MSTGRWYIDTSAFLKLVLDESSSAAFRAWSQDREGRLLGSDLVRVEGLRAARRHSSVVLAEVRERLGALALMRLTPGVCAVASELEPGILRSLDALHLATALTLGDSLEAVVTYDDRLTAAAGLLGLPVAAPH